MAGSLRGGGYEADLDPAELGTLLRQVKQFDRELGKATTRRLRSIAEPGRDDVRRRLLSAPSHSNTGLRRGLAAGTKVAVRTSLRSAGVLIKTDGSKLPADKQAMVYAYDKPSFRRPVFGHRDRWVTQTGRPYFGTTLNPLRGRAADELGEALLDAAATITAGEATR